MTIKVEIDDELAGLLGQFNQSLERSTRELILLELYRRGTISSGKAAEMLGMGRLEFIHYASKLGLPFFDMSQAEWETEKHLSENL